MVKSAYNHLTVFEAVHNEGFNHVLWTKAVPLKVNIFIWRLFLNRLATRDNMFRRHVLVNDDTFCLVEVRDHLFTRSFYSVWGARWIFQELTSSF